MATKFQPRDAAEPTYLGDISAWALHQAELLRAGRFDAIDVENVAEEIESLAKTEFRYLYSALVVIIQHMLKWDYQPERRSRSWVNSISEHRIRAAEQIEENPSLKPRRDEAIRRAWRSAMYGASTETNLAPRLFPKACPYDWDAIMEREFQWPLS